MFALAWYAGNAAGEEPVIPAEQEVIEFQTRLGVVTFRHQMHASLSATECTTCHHTFKAEEGPVKPCHECHDHDKKSADDAPKVKIAFHTRCIGCHEYTAAQGDPAGPLKMKCKLCHVK
jgi:secreted trypsin-like serine protease